MFCMNILGSKHPDIFNNSSKNCELLNQYLSVLILRESMFCGIYRMLFNSLVTFLVRTPTQESRYGRQVLHYRDISPALFPSFIFLLNSRFPMS